MRCAAYQVKRYELHVQCDPLFSYNINRSSYFAGDSEKRDNGVNSTKGFALKRESSIGTLSFKSVPKVETYVCLVRGLGDSGKYALVDDPGRRALVT
jgi:hypothetical protein